MICRCNPFWRFLAIFFIAIFLIKIHHFNVINFKKNRSAWCIVLYLPPLKAALCLLLFLCFIISPPITLFCAILWLPFYFIPTPVVSTSPWTGVWSDILQNFWIFFQGSPFWSSVGPFKIHFLISCFMNVASYVVYFSVSYPPATLWLADRYLLG